MGGRSRVELRPLTPQSRDHGLLMRLRLRACAWLVRLTRVPSEK